MPNALFFQKLIVITEIGLGLAFIFGFFTFIAAIVSIGMHINFALGAGLPQTNGLPGSLVDCGFLCNVCRGWQILWSGLLPNALP